MNPPEAETDLYARAGINDLAEFYRDKFVSQAVLDHRYFRALDRFDLRFARTMWVYDNVRRNSTLLDLGCGAGMLALLKRKGVALTGVDLSEECVGAARRNGYDETVLAELHQLPFADASFDYVASLDVIGHVPREQKDAVFSEIKRVLRPEGVTLHGIECTDRAARRRYDEMSAEELRRFIAIDGHVGLEEEHEHAARFRKFFGHVAWEPRYALCLSSDEFQKQADRYGLPFEADFVDYLRGLSFEERRAFDMAMGYVFGKISDFNVRLPRSGLYVLLKASDAPLGPFYNEHRDRRDLLELKPLALEHGSVCLDRSPHAIFDEGWYEPDNLPPIARWMKARGRIQFRTTKLERIRIDLTTHFPHLDEQPIELTFAINGSPLSACTLFRSGWLDLELTVPEAMSVTGDSLFALEITANHTWQPRPGDRQNRDDRNISIAVCNIRCS